MRSNASRTSLPRNLRGAREGRSLPEMRGIRGVESLCLFHNPSHPPPHQIPCRKTCRKCRKYACNHTKAQAGVLICKCSRQPAKENGEQKGEDQNQNTLGDFRVWVFSLLMFLENRRYGYCQAEKEKDKDKDRRGNRKFP